MLMAASERHNAPATAELRVKEPPVSREHLGSLSLMWGESDEIVSYRTLVVVIE